jgi:predicted TIM-barrel fold metal-dependent hydrolase
MKIIDVHTHAFPDRIAKRAMTALEEGSGVRPEADGTVAGLLELIERKGLAQAWLLNIATRKEQMDSILTWCRELASEKLVPFASVHPEAPDLLEQIDKIAEAGIRGVKMHPMYQRFNVDDPKVFPMYEALAARGLVVQMHAGYDIAFADDDQAAPVRFATVVRNFPGLKLVLAHMGGWKWFDSFIELLAGKDVYIDTSFCVGYCTDAQRDAILSRHSMDRILYGSDSPWGWIEEQVGYVACWPVSDEVKEKIFWRNAEALLRE